jgi:hypothetical protein
MIPSEESALYSLDGGCPVHRDEHMRECSMCGCEFCRSCHPRSTVCPDCAEEREEEDEETDPDPDFDDVEDLDKLIGKDDNLDGMLGEEPGAAPPGPTPKP